MVYLKTDDILQANAQMMVSVPKKSFKKAVDRNLLKRRIREAYRLNKTQLLTLLSAKNQYLLVAFLFIGQQLSDFETIQGNIMELLNRLIENISGK